MALKRKTGPLGSQRRVKVRKEEHWEAQPESEESSPDSDGAAPSEEDAAIQDQDSSSDSEDQRDQDDEDERPPKVDLSSLSFGALAKAQAALPPSRKSKSSASKHKTKDPAPSEIPSTTRDPSRPDRKQPDLKRSSKHAPQEQSSKKPVSRRREILADPRRKARDPRFETFGGVDPLDEARSARAYSFLDEYREGEMAALRAQIKKTKKGGDAAQTEELKRQLMSMESRKKAQVRKDEAETLLAEHRKKEKELVAQGKKPFFLKKSDQKKMLLTERFEKMSKGQVDRAIERKRKKVAGKEKKELDIFQRRER